MGKYQLAPMLKRWLRIALGKSATAVAQGVGKCYSKSEIKGYYNDLTNKVSEATLLDAEGVPYNIMSHGEKVYSLVTISQYALGCYDLYLLNQDKAKLAHFLKLAEYLYQHQEDDGKWDARSSMGSSRQNSSCMAQGQGCSIMLRAYLQVGDKKYLESSKKAVDFMLISADKGGTILRKGESITFEKYPPEKGVASSVLNGWAFALFGLYDYYLLTKDEYVKDIFMQSCKTMATNISLYDCRYWSMYDLVGTIASPAYHDLHIALLRVLADLSGENKLAFYASKFEQYRCNPIKKGAAIVKKIIQKLTTKSDAFIVQ
ncbi:D-glucuronyl C5-epimerase family protein [Ohessyouella blattaphilus]|uniref:D-glucuronyl C5-epimerase family protein n=1 Tax=Ohessyouella blattaphilus TaxID=2949333 RepID=UPI003EBC0182